VSGKDKKSSLLIGKRKAGSQKSGARIKGIKENNGLDFPPVRGMTAQLLFFPYPIWQLRLLKKSK
jgi:hypothetical protein